MTKNKHAPKKQALKTPTTSVKPKTTKNVDINNLFSDVWTKK